MTHAQLVEKAVEWLRAYRCGVVLSEQACVSGEMPDAIGWKRASHSVLVECKISRADFLADRDKPFRQKQELGLGCERFYLTPPALLQLKELPARMGPAGIAQAQGRSHPPLRARPPHRVRPGLRDESAAGQPASGRNPHRAPNHHRISQVEKPNAAIQRRRLSRQASSPPRRNPTISWKRILSNHEPPKPRRGGCPQPSSRAKLDKGSCCRGRGQGRKV